MTHLLLDTATATTYIYFYCLAFLCEHYRVCAIMQPTMIVGLSPCSQRAGLPISLYTVHLASLLCPTITIILSYAIDDAQSTIMFRGLLSLRLLNALNHTVTGRTVNRPYSCDYFFYHLKPCSRTISIALVKSMYPGCFLCPNWYRQTGLIASLLAPLLAIRAYMYTCQHTICLSITIRWQVFWLAA
jgi:hypothetical protein